MPGHEARDGLRLVERAQILALEVLDEGDLPRVAAGNDGRDGGAPEAVDGGEPSLPCDQDEATLPGLATHQNGLQEPVALDRGLQILERIRVKQPPRLIGIRRDRGDIELHDAWEIGGGLEQTIAIEAVAEARTRLSGGHARGSP